MLLVPIIVISTVVDMFSFVAAICIFGTGIVTVTAAFIYMPFYYNTIIYQLDGEKIYKRSGIMIKRYTVIVKVKILYSTTFTTPVLRYFELGNIYFYGCGARLCLCALDSENLAKLLEGVDKA